MRQLSARKTIISTVIIAVFCLSFLSIFTFQAKATSSLSYYFVNANTPTFTTADVDYLMNLGFNGARLPLHWHDIQPTNGISTDPTEISSLDTVINYAEENNFTIVFMMYWTSGAPGPAWAGSPSPDFSGVFANSSLRNAYAYAWGDIASHFAAKTKVMFELLNEPGVGSTLSSSDVPNYVLFCDGCISAIRASETYVHKILVPWMVDSINEEIVTSQTTVGSGDTDIVWVKHTYQPFGVSYNPDTLEWNQYTSSWLTEPLWLAKQDEVCATKAHGFGQDCIITEFGRQYDQVPQENVTAWFNAVLTIFNNDGNIGWTFHSYEQADGMDLKQSQTYYMSVLSPFMPEPAPSPSSSATPSPSPTPSPTPNPTPEGISGVTYYGFRVWELHCTGSITELTSGEPVAILQRSENGSGIQANTWTCPATTVALGYDALKITIYFRDGDSGWVNRGNFISPVLITKQIVSSVWTFILFTNRTDTTSSFTFDTYQYKCGINGVVLTKPLQSEIQAWRLARQDYIGFELGTYMDLIGEGLYVLLLILFAGTLYFRYGHFGIIVMFFAIFGGAGGLAWILLPTWAASIAALIVIIGTTFIVWRIIR